MAKRFFYISAAILCLTAAYQLGAERARAEWDSTRGGQVFGIIDGSHIVDSNGLAWQFNSLNPGVFTRDVEWYDLPVPTGDVKLLSEHGQGAVLVIVNDEVWCCPSPAGWISIGQFPGPGSTEGRSWGATKGAYR